MPHFFYLKEKDIVYSDFIEVLKYLERDGIIAGI
jgi:hypothetical protein